tara:strand:+ start:82 stop:690 length:609 start_codon:yes stop_codon:yes gene_type:complete
MKQIKPGTDLAGKPYAAKDLEGFTEQGSGAYLEDRDPRQMLHDMKTEARANQTMTPADESKAMDYFGQGPPPTRGAETTETPRIGAPGTGPDVKLASGVYEGAGGYEYEVMPGGEIKIVKAPKGRGVGVTLKLGHPAHEAIFDELSEGGSSPKSATPAEEPDAFDTTLAERSSRNLTGGVKGGDLTKAGEEKERQEKTLAKM